MGVVEEVFREYDIRGIVGEGITPRFARVLGQAFGSWALELGHEGAVVGTLTLPSPTTIRTQ